VGLEAVVSGEIVADGNNCGVVVADGVFSSGVELEVCVGIVLWGGLEKKVDSEVGIGSGLEISGGAVLLPEAATDCSD
jgi:hypothetical protein